MTELSPELFIQAKKCLSVTQKNLISDVQTILNILKKDSIHDYSFVVAPAAKAYEGYLKDFFLKIGLIDSWQYQSNRFRVGKTLNPSLRYKRFSIFQKLADIHNTGEELAEILWDGWKYGRNEIFHYFPKNLKKLTLNDAKNRIALILNAIIESHHFFKQTNKQL